MNYQVTDAADVRRYYGQAHGHGLYDHAAHALIEGGKYEQVEIGKACCNILTKTGEVYIGREAKLGCLRRKLFTKRAVAHKHNMNIGYLLKNSGKRGNQMLLAFYRY